MKSSRTCHIFKMKEKQFQKVNKYKEENDFGETIKPKILEMGSPQKHFIKLKFKVVQSATSNLITKTHKSVKNKVKNISTLDSKIYSYFLTSNR